VKDSRGYLMELASLAVYVCINIAVSRNMYCQKHMIKNVLEIYLLQITYSIPRYTYKTIHSVTQPSTQLYFIAGVQTVTAIVCDLISLLVCRGNIFCMEL
jgi:hypothetical protein